MKPTQLAIAKAIVSVVLNNCQQKLVIQRTKVVEGRSFLQILTPLAVLTFEVDKPLPDQFLQDIGAPNNWMKISKGLIDPKFSVELPQQTVQAVTRFGESQIGISKLLLDSAEPLHSPDIFLKPGTKLVLAPSSQTTIWAYNPAGGEGINHMEGDWSKNVEKVSGVWAIINPWVSQILRCFPEYQDGSEDVKLDGASMGSISDRPGVHFVSRSLGLVVACAGATMQKEYTVEVKLTGGSIRKFLVFPDWSAEEITEKGNEEMKATLIDPSALMPKKEEAVNKQDIPVVENKPVNRQEVPTVVNKPVNKQQPVTEHTEFYAKPVPNEDKEPTAESLAATVKAAAEAAHEANEPTADELMESALNNLETIIESAKTAVKAVKLARKKYKTELKDASSGKQQNERIAELEAQLKKIKSALGL